MLGVISLFLFLTVFQAVSSQIPAHCREPPGVNPMDCCKVPRLFKEEDLKECGIEENPSQKNKDPQVCSKHVCILKKYNLMKNDDYVDKEAVAKFLDEWADKNPDFQKATEQAKKRCLEKDLPGPPEICEANKIGFCTMVVTYEECPSLKDSAECKKLKEHMDSCKVFYPF